MSTEIPQAPRGHVVIEHPEAGYGFCLPSALPAWQERGWTAVDNGDVETPAETPTPGDKQQSVFVAPKPPQTPENKE